MDRRPTFEELVEMARNARSQADLRAVDHGRSPVGRRSDHAPASFQAMHYDPTLSAAAIRAEAEARHNLMEPIDAGGEAVEQGFYRLNRINALLASGPVDPAMIELKEEYQRGLLYRLQRYMRPGSGVTEEGLTIEARYRRQQR
ncbi:hypothetical protein ABZ345_45395 [Lentzea sp. NPDC005914]|uniref:hypothetical protein n=1 Tax=Lentzea sp. NPDC005914 TaxID=3154572 RepID=UPI0033DCEC81